MKKRLFTMLLVVLMAIGSMFAFASCALGEIEHTNHPDADNDGYCDVGNEKLDEGKEDGGKDDDNKEYSAPVITVTPAEMTYTKGTPEEEFSLLFGVTVTDEYDKDLKATVKNDGGFDINVVGDYTVTYSAKNSKGKEGTGTRTYHVVAPPPSLILKVQKENDAKNWVETLGHAEGLMTFPNEEYYELTADTAYSESTKGVFHNKSTASIIVSVPGGHGEAAILNSAGVVIEARDGANGKLVNKENPSRPSSSVSSLPEEWFGEPAEGETLNYTVASNYAFHMEIPAGGYAIVIPAGGSFDADGRGWLNKNVVYQYGAAVKLYFEDEPDALLTVYEDQAPVVLSAESLIVRQNDGTTVDAAEALLLEGISYVDDHGTWDIADDVKEGLDIEIVSRPTPAYDNAVLGTYTYKLRISDGTKTTEFERSIVVREPVVTMPTIKIDGKWYEFDEGNILVNPAADTADLGKKSAIVYTSYFTGDYFVNDYGFYFIVGTDGKIRETLTPYNGGKISRYDADGTTVKEETISTTNVLANVKGNLKMGEYVVLAVNVNGGSKTNSGVTGVDLRAKLGNEVYSASETHMLGLTVEMELIDWMPTVTVSEEGKEDKTWSGNNIYYNVDVDAGKASGAAFLVYTKAFTGSFGCNGYGVAYVLNEEGKILRVYDATSGAPYYLDEDHYWPAGDGAGGARIPGDSTELPEAGRFAAGNYANIAFNNLKDGEILLVFPHSGTTDNNPRAFGGQFRQDFKKYTVSFSNFEIEVGGAQQPTDEMQIKIGSATLTVATAPVNDAAAKAVEDGVIIYTKSYAGTLLNGGYGVAVVVGADNKIVATYDGANAKLYNAENPNGEAKCTPASYISEAFAATPTGGYIIVFPNVGANTVRAWALSNARGGAIGATVELVNIDLA